MTQQFFLGDRVRVAKDLGPSMRHFGADQEAIVIASEAEQCGNGSNGGKPEYTIYLLKDKDEVSWYREDQLTFIEQDRQDLLPKSHIQRKIYEAKKLRSSPVNR